VLIALIDAGKYRLMPLRYQLVRLEYMLERCIQGYFNVFVSITIPATMEITANLPLRWMPLVFDSLACNASHKKQFHDSDVELHFAHLHEC
jgi:hypothetical protein